MPERTVKDYLTVGDHVRDATKMMVSGRERTRNNMPKEVHIAIDPHAVWNQRNEYSLPAGWDAMTEPERQAWCEAQVLPHVGVTYIVVDVEPEEDDLDED